MSSPEFPAILTDNLSLFSNEVCDFIRELVSLNQQHLFIDWDPVGVNDNLKVEFMNQLGTLNKSYPGGIKAYIANSLDLLLKAKNGENPLEGWSPEVPHGVTIDPMSPEHIELERLGLEEIALTGFVLVAGGLGERLGYSGIKVELPSETITHTSYLELYCQSILAIQQRYGDGTRKIPFAIMVSDDTHHKTIAFLERNNYFSLDKSQVYIMKQEKVPALLDNHAHISKVSKYVIDAKPHGHGDVHSLMHLTGTLQAWRDQGVKWIYFFQDTNGLAFATLAAQLGVSRKLGLEVNSMSIPRFAKQAVGAIVKLTHSDGRHITTNVEYNQLDPLLRATISPEGDVNDPTTRHSPFPGNINQLIFELEPYYQTLEGTSGAMPEFVNPKYADSSREMFKKPTRLECMMQDYPKLLGRDSRVGFTEAPSWMAFSPCKNNIVDAAAAMRSGVPAGGAFTAESDQYHVWCELLTRLGASMESAPVLNVAGIEAVPSPRIVFHPSFVVFPSELIAMFEQPRNVCVSANSTVVMRGRVKVMSLNVNGSVQIEGSNQMTMTMPEFSTNKFGAIENAGHVLTRIEDLSEPQRSNVSEVDRMRGYVIVCQEVKVIRLT